MKTKYLCPSCRQETISAKEKWLAGVWRIIHCRDCGARLCANPYLMAVAYMIYAWALAWFGFLAYFQHSPTTLLYLIPVWLTLDLLNVRFMPLSLMRPKT